MVDLGVVHIRELIDRKKPLVGIESKVPRVVVGKVQGFRAVADNEELHKAQQRFGIAVSGIVLVLNDLFHRPPWADPQRLEFNLDNGHAVDQQHDVVAVVAVVGVDAELIDDFEGVLAPVLDVDKRVVERRAIIADERLPIPQRAGRFVHVGRDDLIEEALELAVGKRDPVQGLEFFPEVGFKRGPITDVRAILVFEIP